MHKLVMRPSGNKSLKSIQRTKAEHTHASSMDRAGNTDHGNDVGLGPCAVGPLEGLDVNLSGNRSLHNRSRSHIQT
jgi:hypothetical protein